MKKKVMSMFLSMVLLLSITIFDLGTFDKAQAATTYYTLESVNRSGYYVKHEDGIGKLGNVFNYDQDRQWKIVQGLADTSNSSSISLESVNFPGYYLRHQDGTLRLGRNDGTTLFKADATFTMENGLSDSTKVSFKSYNFPTMYIRHSNDNLIISAISASSSTSDKQDATFKKNSFTVNETKDPDHINPILPAYLADPTIHKFGNMYYIYSTVTDFDDKDNKLVWSSPDLLNWTATPLVLNVDTSTYGGNYEHKMLWAPSVIQGPDNKYYMYYTVLDFKPGNPVAGTGYENNIVAVSDYPTGPFTIKKCITYGASSSDINFQKASTHDPQVFKDGNNYYLIYGGYWYGPIIQQLNSSDLTSTVGSPTNVSVSGSSYAEGSFLIKKGSRYYMSYSVGNYDDSTYGVQYTYSDNGIMGPYTYPTKHTILESNSGTNKNTAVGIGTGHHSVLEENGEYYIVYNKLALDTEKSIHRQVCIDRMTFDSNNLINRVNQSYDANGVTLLHDATTDENLAYYANSNVLASASSTLSSSNYPTTAASYALDSNNATEWIAGTIPTKADSTSKQNLTIDLGSEKTISGFKTDFWLLQRYHQYKIYYSSDNSTWTLAVDKSNNTTGGTMIDDLSSKIKARYVKLEILEAEKYSDETSYPKVGVWEFKIKRGTIDFTNTNTNEWSVYDGTWNMNNGEYSVQALPGAKTILKDSVFKDFEMNFRMKNGSIEMDSGVMFRATNIASGVDAFNGYYVGLTEGNVVLGKMTNGTYQELSRANYNEINFSDYHNIKLIVKGSNVKAYLDGALVLQYNSLTDLGSGNIGLRAHATTASFDDLNIKVFK